MTYLDPHAPSGESVFDLLFYPYHEGARNLEIAFSLSKGSGENSPSLSGRVTHALLGAALLIPVINTVLFVAMRLFSIVIEESSLLESQGGKTEKNDRIPDWAADTSANFSPDPAPKLKASCGNNFLNREKLQALNARRQTLEKKKHRSTSEKKRNQYNKQLIETEKEAVALMRLSAPKLYTSHLKAKTVSYDGKLIGAKQPVHYKNRRRKITSTLRQVPGLSQETGKNNLCGYYALYFMLQAVTEGSFTDREAAQPILNEWVQLILQKRAASYFSTKRDQPLPEGYSYQPASITPCEIDYLIQNAPSLAPIREKSGCFLLNMDDLTAARQVDPTHEFFQGAMQPVELLGKSKAMGQPPSSFPIYFLIKSETESHYYFAYAKEGGDFTVVHSMNFSVLEKGCDFRAHTFPEIVKALQGKDTSLNLSWPKAFE